MTEIVETEKALLASVLEGYYKDVPALSRTLTGADFDDPKHEQIWHAITGLHRAGQPIDKVTVRHELIRQDPRWTTDARYLFDLSAMTLSGEADWYADQIRDASLTRMVEVQGHRMINASNDVGLSAADRVAMARKWVDELDERHRTTGSVTSLESFEALMDLVDRGGIPVLPSPWSGLNSIIGGVRDGELWIAAARPSVGKSIFLENWGTHVARHTDGEVLLISMEMSHTMITARTLAHTAKVPLSAILNGDLLPSQMDAISGAYTQIQRGGMRISDRRTMTADDIRSEAWSVAQDAKRRGTRLRLILIDYVGLVHAPRDRNTSRQQALGVVSRSLKVLAGELDCPVIAASQLNRQITGKGLDARPTMADIRESGDFEQDADGVILLHAVQEEDPQDNTISDTGEIEIIVDKDRNGAKGTALVERVGKYARYKEPKDRD